MMNITLKQLSRLILLPALSLAVLVGCGGQESDAGRPASGTTVSDGLVRLAPDSAMLQRIAMATAEQGQLPLQSFSVPARIESDPLRSAAVRLPVPGRVQELMVQPGDEVSAGQPLLRIDSAEVAAVLAEHRQARAELRQAENELTRSRELFDIDAIPRRQLQEAERDLELAQAEYDQARGQLEFLGLQPGQSGQSLTVTAPIAGKVLSVAVAAGELVADEDEVVVSLADLSQVMAVASVPERRVSQLMGSRAARLESAAWPQRQFIAEIVRISDVVDEDSRTVSVYLRIDNSEALLRPAMFANVRLEGETGTLVVVPAGSVIYRGSQALLLVERSPGEFEVRNVVTAPLRGDQQPILEGLQAGERVVTDGALLLLEQGRAS